MQVKKKLIKLTNDADGVNGRAIPANFTPSNYTPAQVASEGTDKISAHLKGIDTVLASTGHDPVTLTAVGSTPNANAASLSTQALTLQPADASFPGVVTTGAQTIAGDKTLTGVTHTSGGIVAKDNVSWFYDAGDTTKKFKVDVSGTTGTTSTLIANQSADRDITLPDATTTLLGHDNTATVSGKTLSLSNNTISSTASRVAVFNGSGELAADANVSTTELSYLDGVIAPTSFSAANNQAAAADVTGLAFANGTVRSFEALVSVHVDATSDLFESFRLHGIQRGADWVMSQSAVGDASGFTFTITTAGQVQYTSESYAGFSSATIKFRATVLAT